MERNLFDAIAAMLRLGAAEIGMDGSSVVVDGESITLEGTGVSARWRYDAFGTGQPGWQVDETFHRLDVLSDGDGMETKVIGTARPEECFEVARAVILSAVDAKLAAALSPANG